jgi:stage IV sporulation protein A
LELLQKALFEFPVTRIDVRIPKWLQTLSEENVWVSSLLGSVREASGKIVKMRDCFTLETLFSDDGDFLNPEEIRMDLGKGKAEISVQAKPQLFYRVLSDTCGESLSDDLALMQYMQSVANIKREYDKIKDAFKAAEEHGYGIAYPSETEYVLEKPQLVKKNAGYAVQFRAHATSYHIVKVEISGSVNPIIGTKEQSEEFVNDTLRVYDEGEEKVWETNIFGKSLRTLVGDELAQKSGAMPLELRRKVRRVVTRAVNEGKNNVVCILF